MSRIFLSYRRDDSNAETGRIYQLLSNKFGEQHLFRDVDSIPAGTNFVERLNDCLNNCSAVVVIIGDRWLDIKNHKTGQRRLEEAEDFVRIEVEASLKRDIPVIPLLVNNANFPSQAQLPAGLKPLVNRQFIMVRESQFEEDVNYLAKQLETTLGFYHGVLSEDIADGLRQLSTRIGHIVPASKAGQTLNLATWNIRMLGRVKRTKKSLHYLAEIIGQFDIVGITEAEKHDGDLRKIEHILGPFWQTLYCRGFVYLYDSRKIRFNGDAAQIDGLSPIGKMKNATIKFPFLRNPYMVSFTAGKIQLVLILVHLRWGNSRTDRLEEAHAFAQWFEKYHAQAENEQRTLIALGSFQVESPKDPIDSALAARNIKSPKALQTIEGNNLKRNKYYQQIVALESDHNIFTKAGGIMDFYQDDSGPLYPGENLNLNKFSSQLSDLLPLWVQLKVD